MPTIHSRSCTRPVRVHWCEIRLQTLAPDTSDSRKMPGGLGLGSPVVYLKQIPPGNFGNTEVSESSCSCPAGQTYFCTKTDVNRSPRRWDLKHLDRQIGQFSCPVFWVTGTPVYFRERQFKFIGNSVKTCLKVTGTPMKTCWNFDSSNYSDSKLLRLWCTHTIMYIS